MGLHNIVNKISDELFAAELAQYEVQWIKLNDREISKEARAWEEREEREAERNRGWGEERRSVPSRKDDVKKQYVKLFNEKMKPYLKGLWEQRVKDTNLVGQLEQFFTRHPWLEPYKNLEDNKSIAYEYIEPLV